MTSNSKKFVSVPETEMELGVPTPKTEEEVEEAPRRSSAGGSQGPLDQAPLPSYSGGTSGRSDAATPPSEAYDSEADLEGARSARHSCMTEAAWQRVKNKKRRQRNEARQRKIEERRQRRESGATQQEASIEDPVGPNPREAGSRSPQASRQPSRVERRYQADYPTLDEGRRPRGSRREVHSSRPNPRYASRGPGVRDAARAQARERRYILPTEPRSVREERRSADSPPPAPTQAKRPREPPTGTPPAASQPEKRRKEGQPSSRRRDEGGYYAGVSPLQRPEDTGARHGSYRDAARSSSDWQVVVRSEREGGIVSKEEAEALRKNLKVFSLEVLKEMRPEDQETQFPPIRYEQAGLVPPGWLLITAMDNHSQEWTLQNWKPPRIEGINFLVGTSRDAPWPTRIGVFLKEEEKPTHKELVEEIRLRNEVPGIKQWRPDKIEGSPGEWHMSFWVPKETVEELEGYLDWRICIGLISIKVHRMGRRPLPDLPRAEELRQEVREDPIPQTK